MNPQSCFLRSFLYLIVSTCAAQVVDISYTSQGYPDFYLNDQITFTCTASGFTDIGILELRYDGGSVSQSGCAKDIEGNWGTRGAPVINEVTGIESPSITKDYCIAIAKPEGFTLEVKVNITDTSIRGKFYCRGFQPGDESAVPSSEVTIRSIKVAPEDLTLITTPSEDNIVEGEEFSFICSTSNTESSSTYEYKINGQTTNKYTPKKADRDGITISCKDTAHSNWKGGNTMESIELKPKYIDTTVEGILTQEFNPSDNNVILDCANKVEGRPVPDSFKWTRNNKTEPGGSAGTLKLTQREAGASEIVRCEASNGLSKPVSIQWNVAWSEAATVATTSTPATNKSPQPQVNMAAVGGGVAAGVIGSIIIVVVIVCCLKKNRRSKSSANGGQDMENLRGNENQSKPKPVSGKGKPIPQSRSTKKEKRNSKHANDKPQAQPELRHQDDPIIYADLVHDAPAKLITKPANQNPPESVEYASIDHLKTRRYQEELNSEPTIPTMPAPPPPHMYGNMTDN